MKFISYIFTLLVILLVTIYVLLFTSIGHGIISNQIETVLKSKISLDSKVERFSLSLDTISLYVQLSHNNRINFEGKYSILDKSYNINYNVKLNDISKFNKLTSQQLQGRLYTNGTIKGDDQKGIIKGFSDIAKSDTNYEITLTKDNIKNGKLIIKEALLTKILYITNQKQYAKGKINLEIDLENVKLNNIKGKGFVTLKDGVLNKDLIKNDFNITLPHTTFNTKIDLDIDKVTDIKLDFDSNLIQFLLNGKYLQSNNKFNSKYYLKVEDLNRLRVVTKKPLRGEVVVKGDISLDDRVNIRSLSKLLGGDIAAELDHKNYKSIITGIDTMKLLHMLYYPKIYKGKLDGNIDGNIDSEIINFNLDLKNGHFITNQLTLLISNLLNIDITDEKFTYAVIKGTKNKNIIDANINMNSNKLKITSKTFKLDTAKRYIDTILYFQYQKYKFDIKIKGDIDKPKIKSDIGKSILKEKVKSKIKKELEKKLDEKGRDILNNLFKL
ncbi:MAG: hypothetical protein U9Q33_00330 [Campylobacterota bacterium]|nr:hypothetical protein [Campylobacterota bacterium]